MTMSNLMGLPILAAEVAISLDGSQQPLVTAAMIEDKTYGDPQVEGDPFVDQGGEG
jgi:hypothetical protein